MLQMIVVVLPHERTKARSRRLGNSMLLVRGDLIHLARKGVKPRPGTDAPEASGMDVMRRLAKSAVHRTSGRVVHRRSVPSDSQLRWSDTRWSFPLDKRTKRYLDTQPHV